MKRWIRVLNFLVVAGAATAFAAANGDQWVRIELGVVTLSRVSLPVVVFASVLLGMVLVLAAGLRGDLRARRRLRRYEELLDREA